MRIDNIRKILLVGLSFALLTANAQVKTPAQLYPELFKAVQMNKVYSDGKTFPDAIPLAGANVINQAYQTALRQPAFDLTVFVRQYFKEPGADTPPFISQPGQSLRQHIDTLWTVLQRSPDTIRGTSLLPLNSPYIVPGGRFREIYYWDSYFTMLGLQQAKKNRLIDGMVANFAYLIDQYGHIPNGNRSYYLSRSQPPFFSFMVSLLAATEGKSVLIKYRPELIKEYNFWMTGSTSLKLKTATEHVVKMPDGSLLNRYWDDSDQPREESYGEDVVAGAAGTQKPADFYRNMRAAAESGWDFSSRWFRDGQHLTTIQTTSLVPVDLNCLLYHLETTIADSYKLSGDRGKAAIYRLKALKRKKAVLKYCWSERDSCFMDYNWVSNQSSTQYSIATAYPLFIKIASSVQAAKVAVQIKTKFLQEGGVATTLIKSGQQWDRPNGWAPLQYVTITGLNNYKVAGLAKTIAMRWISRNRMGYQTTGKLLEKYNIEIAGDAANAGGGEYPLQDGFGWTNGVLLMLMNEYGVQ